MAESSIDTPLALDLAIAASLKARRDRLERALRMFSFRVSVATGLAGCLGMLAIAAWFVARDRQAFSIIAVMAMSVFALTLSSWQIGRRWCLRELQAMDAQDGSRSP